VLLDRIGRPWDAYALRILNLILPLLFAVFLVLHRAVGERRQFFASNHLLTTGLLGLLILAACTLLHHAIGFRDFRWRLSAAIEVSTGYVAAGDALPGEKYAWGWTYPTMSLLFHAEHRTPIRAIVYNPNAKWEPFGPTNFAELTEFVSRLGLSLADESWMANQALEVTARKLAEPQR
jgi:hypothetical protein